jgi:glycosyltransferase involved in cell wall biosynthesis
VSEDRIVTVHESIELPDLPLAAARRDARARWAVPEDAFVVGISGTMDWRKGVDLLAPLAVQVERRQPPRPVHWMWVGGEREGPLAGMVEHDFKHCGLSARLHLTGTVEAPLDAFSAFDAFVVLSREDAYPLVMLEAGALKLPVLCFDGAGGAPEFVRDDAGFVVPYLDLSGMAARLAELCASPEKRHALGNAAFQRVRTEHDVAVVAPRIVDLIHGLLTRSRQ